jgi:hypothetical protein
MFEPYKSYIYVAGGSFDPDSFIAGNGRSLGGAVGVTKDVIKNGRLCRSYKYWASPKITIQRRGDSELELTVQDVVAAIEALKLVTPPSVILQFVGRFNFEEGVTGINISTKVVQLLARLGASVDFDHYLDGD